MNRGEEDYLKAIYELALRQADDDLVPNISLAEYFSHTPQTVNEMIRRLSEKGLVDYKPYKGSKLTKAGLKVAVRLIRIHRIWETFLVTILGYEWDQVHEDAENLEHVTSKMLENKLYDFLGRPSICPHGNIIPSEDGKINRPVYIRLFDASEGKDYYLKRVIDDKNLLKYIGDMGLAIDKVIRVVEIDKISEVIKIEVEGSENIIGFKLAKNLHIAPV